MLLHEDLARARTQSRLATATRDHRRAAVLAARTAGRLQASAERRARLANDAATYAATYAALNLAR